MTRFAAKGLLRCRAPEMPAIAPASPSYSVCAVMQRLRSEAIAMHGRVLSNWALAYTGWCRQDDHMRGVGGGVPPYSVVSSGGTPALRS